MWFSANEALGKDLCAALLKVLFLQIVFFKASHRKVCEAYSDLFAGADFGPDSLVLIEISHIFAIWEGYNPHTHFGYTSATWYN